MPTVSPEDLRVRISARIRETATRRRLPIYRLADKAGVSRAHVWAILRGEKSLTGDVLAKLAAALEVDPSALVRPYRGTPPSPPVDD